MSMFFPQDEQILNVHFSLWHRHLLFVYLHISDAYKLQVNKGVHELCNILCPPEAHSLVEENDLKQ